MYFSNQWKLSEKKISELLNRLYNETSSKYDDKYYIVSHDVKVAISFNQSNETATMLVFLYGKISFPLLRTIFQDANLVHESGARQLIGLLYIVVTICLLIG